MKKCNGFVSAGCILTFALLASSSRATTSSANAAVVRSDESGTISSSNGGSVDSAAMLAAHNKWRSKTGLPNLNWSTKLSGIAQQWASHLAASSCSHGHSGNEYGENLFMASPAMWSSGRTELQNITPEHVVDSWGSEVKDYDYSDNSCHSVCGHYTQLVWKDTADVGCAMAVCDDKSQIWVCNYYPAGNMVGEKPY